MTGDKIFFEMDQTYINTHTDLSGTIDVSFQLDEAKIGSSGSSKFVFPGTTDELVVEYKEITVSDAWKSVNNTTTEYSTPPVVSVQEENGDYKLNYSVTARPSASLTSLVLSDTLGEGQTVDASSFVIIAENGQSYTVPATAVTPTANGFEVDIASVIRSAGDSIRSGMKYTVNYSTNVAADKVDGNAEITNKASWKWDGKSTPETKTMVKPKRATSISKAVSASENAEDGYLYTLTYTITVGDETHPDVSGVKVQDYLQDYQLLNGSSITVTGKNGSSTTLDGSAIKWVDDQSFGDTQKALFEYTFPANSNNGPYTITYTTVVPADVGRSGQVGITNRVTTNDGGESGTSYPVDFGTQPGPGASIDKAFAGWTGKDGSGKVTSAWTIDVNVAADAVLPLQNVVVTETDCFTATAGWYPREDAIVDYTNIVVRDKETGDTLTSGIDYTVDADAGTITFSSLRKSVRIEISASGAVPENGWFENSASLTVNGKPAGSDKDNRQYGSTTFDKSVSYDETSEVFIWTVKLNTLKNTVELDGPVYFSDLLPEGMQLLNYATGSTSDPSVNINVGGMNWDNWNQSVSVVGREIQRFYAKYNLSGNEYTFTYKTRLTDSEMASYAQDEDGTKTYTNVAFYYTSDSGEAEGEASRDVTYEYDILDKTLTSVSNDIVSYKIDINPDELKLNEGREMTLVDTLTSTNIDLLLDSVKIKDEAGNGVAGAAAVYNDDMRTLTVTVPDQMHVILTYDVIAQNIGENTFRNTAVLNGNYSWVEENTTARNIIQHGATVKGEGFITLSKIDENYVVDKDGKAKPKALSGATFALYQQPIDFTLSGNDTDGWTGLGTGDTTGEPIRVNRANETASVFSSSEDGTVLFDNITYSEYDTLYFWQEVSAPEGYQLDNTKHYFVMYESDSKADIEQQNKDKADILDRIATRRDKGIIINKVATGAAWTVVNKTDGLSVNVSKAWKDSAGTDKSFDADTAVYFKLYQVVGQNDPVLYQPTGESTPAAYTGNGVWKIAYSAENHTWAEVAITGLPETVDGQNVQYYVEEVNQDGTQLSSLKNYNVSYKAGSNQPKDKASDATLNRNGDIVITNSDFVTIRAKKLWNDNNNADGMRPESIKLHLVRDGKQLDASYDKLVSPDASGNWTAEWTKLSSGHTYSVVEEAIAGYAVSYNPEELSANGEITVTNTDNRLVISVNKKWVKNNYGTYTSAAAPAAGSVTVELLKNGTVIDTQRLTAPSWYYTWRITDYQAGDKYTVNEVPDSSLFTYQKTVYKDAQGYSFVHEVRNGKEMAVVNLSRSQEDHWKEIKKENEGQYINYTEAQQGGTIEIWNSPIEQDKAKTQVIVKKLWQNVDNEDLPVESVAEKTVTVELLRAKTAKVNSTVQFIYDGKTIKELEVGAGEVHFNTTKAPQWYALTPGHYDYDADISRQYAYHNDGTATEYTFSAGVGQNISVIFKSEPGILTIIDYKTPIQPTPGELKTTGKTIMLNAPGFTGQFYNLETSVTENGTLYDLTYAVKELNEEGFITYYSTDGTSFKPSMEPQDSVGGAGTKTITIKNQQIPEEGKQIVEKKWITKNGTDWPEGATVEVTLFKTRNGETVQVLESDLPSACPEKRNPVTLNKNKTEAVWDHLPVTEEIGGITYPVTYSVRETAVSGIEGYENNYSSVVSVSESGNYTAITNAEKVSVNVQKTWTPSLPGGTTWEAEFQLMQQEKLIAVNGKLATRAQIHAEEGVDESGWSTETAVTEAETITLNQNQTEKSIPNLPSVRYDAETGKVYQIRYSVVEQSLTIDTMDSLAAYTPVITAASPDNGYQLRINNTPTTVDVPVEKSWPDFDSDEKYDWSVRFRLQWAPIYQNDTSASGDFQDVRPIQELTITKEMMAKGDRSLSQRSFKNLPKYGWDSNGVYRIQYSLEEMEYTVTENGSTLYTYSKGSGYNTTEEDTHYEAFYPHDAGELDESDADYFIRTTNHRRNTTNKKYIDITLNKIWNGHQDDENAWAEFQVKRYKHTEYRDDSHATQEDLQQRVTVSLVKPDGSLISAIEIPKKTSVHVAATFVPHGETKNLSLVKDGDQVTISSSVSNEGDEIQRSVVWYPENDLTISVVSGEENLVGGYHGIQLLNTDGRPTRAEPDTAYTGEILRLSKENNWSGTVTVLQQETSTGIVDNNENISVYGYYFEEVRSNPTGYAAKFLEHGSDTVPEGTAANRIYGDDQVVDAVNEEASQLIVKKRWRGVPVTKGYPEIKFELWCGYREGDIVTVNGNQTWLYKGADNTHEPYRITLNESNEWTWICPESLPKTVADPNQQSQYHEVGYFVKEILPSDSERTLDGTKWDFYQYYNDNGNAYNQVNQGGKAGIVANSDGEIEGTITIVNKINDYYQMDIKKQFFMIREDGAWDNVTAGMCHDAVLGFKVIRRVVFQDKSKTQWMDYGDEMLVGYDGNGGYVLDNGGNGFFLEYAGGDWHFRIRDEEHQTDTGDLSGLPKTGYYVNDQGETVSVKYEYSFRETGVYKDTNRTPYPEWEWFSTITPDRYIGENGQESSEFGIAFANQDGERVANYQASDLLITKRWLGEADAEEVYVKIWRKDASGNLEDFTKIIADDTAGRYPENHPAYGNSNWQGYMEDTRDIDTVNNWLVLTSNQSGDWTTRVKIHNALIRTTGAGGSYTYYIKEVGYKDKEGNVHLTVGPNADPNALTELETHYTRWVDDHWEVSPSTDGADKAIQIGATGENRLEVMNAPKMDLTVEKKWLDENGNPREPWNDSITFQIEQISTKWVNGEPTGETKSSLVNIDGEDRFTIDGEGKNPHWIIDLANRKSLDMAHNVYATQTGSTNDGAAWTFYLDGLYQGYFDANLDEWHCEYVIREVDAVKSDVAIESTGTSSQIVTVSNTYSETGAVKITKTFSGIKALPESFKITATWTDGESATHTVDLKVTGDQPANVTLSGNGSKDNPYVWTISKLPLGEEVKVTFTESGFETEGYDITVTSTTDTNVTNENPITIVAVADNAINSGSFTNTYVPRTGELKITKQVKAKANGAESGADITTTLADGEYIFRIYEEDGVTLAKDADGKPVEDISIIITNGVSKTAEVKNLLPGKYKVMEISGSNSAVTLNYEQKEVTVTGNTSGDDIPETGIATITNTLETVEVSADKKWVGADETELVWPEGATVTFGVFAGTSTTPLAIVELNGTADTNRTAPNGNPWGYEAAVSSKADDSTVAGDEDETKATGGKAVFVNLPKKDKDGKTIVYTIKETVPYTGYENKTPEGVENKGTIVNTPEAGEIDIKIVKVIKGTETKLAGAAFTLTQLNEEGKGDYKTDDQGNLVKKEISEVSTDGVTTFEKIGSGYYEVKESTTPAGYVLDGNSTFYFKVENGAVTWLEKGDDTPVTLWNEKTKDDTNTVKFTKATADKPDTFTVGNQAGTELPQTGGIGTTLFTALGGLMTVAAGAVLTLRTTASRRRGEKQAS